MKNTNEPPHAGLRLNLLDEPLILWRSTTDGTATAGSLPDLMAAMAANEVRDFPALRPHQRHAWHAFLVQLGAIALHHAGRTDPWPDAAGWRVALIALTPEDSDGAAWCLVTPPDRPALLQPPVPGEDPLVWNNHLATPDQIDMLVTSRAHDLKPARMHRTRPDDWLFALVSCQTQGGFLGAGNYGISRMNGGFATRPGIGIAAVGTWGGRWRADVAQLLARRGAIAHDRGFRDQGGHALLWLIPWSGTDSIAMESLDPLYIEVCRRLRLGITSDRITARTTTSKTERVAGKALRGVTGDAWTPVDVTKVEPKALTVGPAGLGYKLMSALIGGEGYRHGAAWRLDGWPADAKIEVIAQATARGQGKTEGYHERRVPIPPKMRRLLAGRDDERAVVAATAKRRIDEIAEVRSLLWHALALLFANGDAAAINDAVTERAGQFAKPLEQGEDGRFFADLAEEIEADDAERSAVHLRWQEGLAERAEAVLHSAFDAGPRNGLRRYKAQSAALGRFHAGLRGAKPILPDLAHYYRKQQATASATEKQP